MTRTSYVRFTVAAVMVASTAASVRADLFHDVAIGLGYAGFSIEGDRNVISGGYDVNVGRNFLGNPIDFGTGDLALAGPISLSVSTGTRYPDTFDISLRTAVNEYADASALAYQLNYDPGSQSTSINGSLFIDTNLSINKLGYYDFDLQYSSRQDVDNDGRYENDAEAYDSDVGPIDVSGNIFADTLAILTDPLFDAAGTVNIFANFSGNNSLSALMTSSSDEGLLQLADGSQSAKLISAPIASDKSLSQISSTSVPEAVLPGALADSSRTIPEPAVLLLLLLGVPFVLRRPLRHL
ncbi:MAG: hypothetical protein KJ749_12510 [Planctomycetes bacterium]|nr:hypothetical protein [Planctomycetota bacterium]